MHKISYCIRPKILHARNVSTENAINNDSKALGAVVTQKKIEREKEKYEPKEIGPLYQR